MIAKFTCSNCGKVTEVKFDPADPKRNSMITLKLFADDGTHRKCDHCGKVLISDEDKEGTTGL